MDIRFPRSAARADGAVLAHARRSFQAGMQHRSDRVEHIDIQLGDAHGRRPQQDSYCVARVKLHGTPAATVVDVGADVYRAIERAVYRACRLVEEQLRLAGRLPAPRAAGSAA